MALATTCPQCMTSFRVVPDQLKLRRGLVRCGTCQHVFSGIDYLRYVDDSHVRDSGDPDDGSFDVDAITATALLAPEAILGTDDDATSDLECDIPTVRDDGTFDDALDQGTSDDGASDDGASDDGASDDGASEDRALGGAIEHRADDERPREKLDDVFSARSEGDDFADVAAIEVAWDTGDDEDLQRFEEAAASHEASVRVATPPSHAGVDVEWVTVAAPSHDALAVDRELQEIDVGIDADERADESAIDYFSTRQRGVGFIDRHGAAAVLVAVFLAVLLAAQWVVFARSAIAARVPAMAPALAAVLAPFGMRIDAPRELESLTIEAFELHAAATPDLLEMSALLRNRAGHAVRWPSMQLTLTDPSNRVLVRKVIGPDDYLREASGDAQPGVPPHAEWPLRLALEARDLRPAGYDVLLFYP